MNKNLWADIHQRRERRKYLLSVTLGFILALLTCASLSLGYMMMVTL